MPNYKGKKKHLYDYLPSPKKWAKRIICIIFALILLFYGGVFLIGGGAVDLSKVSDGFILSELMKLKGDLIGQSFDIYEFDADGGLNFIVSGEKVNITQETDRAGEETSYLKIMIDGSEWNHVGSTLVFVEKGAKLVTDFDVSKIAVSKSGSLGFMGVDRVINHYRNLLGTSKAAIVEAQHGQPILLFQGNSVYKEIPANLPKMTLLMLDGKHVYIHRANINILPAKML